MAKAFREIKTVTGDFMRVNIFPVRQYQYGRKKKMKPTAAAQEKLNRERRAHLLGDIINLNFTEKDNQFKLDYTNFAEEHGRQPTPDECIREVRSFLRRLKRWSQRQGIEHRYIYTSELGVRGAKSHHHLVIDGRIPFTVVRELWHNGGLWTRKLYFDKKGCYSLAGYFVKSAYTYRSFTCSKNLKRPTESGEDKSVFKSDYKIRQKQVNYFTNGDIAEIAKLYPGWQVAEMPTISQTLDEETGELRLPKWGIFITLYLYKPSGLSDSASLYEKFQEINEWRRDDDTKDSLQRGGGYCCRLRTHEEDRREE